MSWDELLDHGDEPFDLSFPLVHGVHPSLTLKAASVNNCGNNNGELLNSIVDCEIARDTDVGHTRIGEYVTSKRVSDLNDAVAHFELVLERCPVDHPDHAAALTNFAYARLEGYIHKDRQDIDSTTCLFRDVLALRSQGHPVHPSSLYHLLKALIWRYSQELAAVDIRKSAQIYHELLPLCPEGTYLRTSVVGAGGLDYVISECNNLPIDASDEDIRLRRIVLELCPQGHQHRPRALNQLSLSLMIRFSQCGSIVDIDESIQLGREAVSLCPEGHPDCGLYLNNLTFSLRSYRFRHQGKSDDLNEAISLYEEALCLSPVGHESRDALLDNLGGALLDRFKQCGEVENINRVISLYREALTLRPPGHQDRDTTLCNLAVALQTRYGKSHAKENLNEAIELYRESIRSRQHDDPEPHKTPLNLSSALCSRFTRTQKIEDVEEAIRLCQESLVALPSLHPDRYYSYMWLQEAYLSRYEVQCNSADLSLAVENFRLASTHPTQGFPERTQEAIDWACEAEVYQHGSALEAYRTCLDLFDNHVMTRSSIISRRDAAAAFRGAQSLPVDAASCAIHHNDLRGAVELGERGRGQQWSMASRLRTPLDDLKFAGQSLAHKLLELNKRLSDAQGPAGSTDRAAADRAVIEYRKIMTEWEATVAEVRNIQGFLRFLLPPSYEDLQAAANDGPVIILIASKYSCNALIVLTSGQPHHVPFPSVTLADLSKLKDDFAMAIRHASLMGPTESRTELIVLLRKVWDEIMLPIVKVLLRHDLKVKPRSRIWLCPTAAFTSIPLHAAHPSRTKADRSGRELSLEDIYVCSYTPTLSALIRSRQAMKTMRRATPSVVAIGQSQPGAGQGTALATVDSELELVHKLLPPNVKFTSLSGEKATQAGALDALRRNTWVHLACHGKQDREQPYNSRFAMRDKPLTLLDIMENDTPQAEFAFLSACHTAVGDENTPDEAIHLAAGLQFSGFKSVIGTLWVVDDEVAKHVVEAFYENMFKDLKDGVLDCTKAAKALNTVIFFFCARQNDNEKTMKIS
ncbi:CHAT domain-containing protein [Suillus paluster]|uniref:CHAT domain-containing protein n=1 Tax=Suillus paluster TaxID=48578 RepID=UPI001B871389|nr:CHAT domain-containing protein [Suillus paluster]KAG1736166.1 CHAT domain-containing protein [Suillus paluster]